LPFGAASNFDIESAATTLWPAMFFPGKQAYLGSPFVGVTAGFCLRPDWGITVFGRFVGMVESTSTRFSGLRALQSIP
jgi:hypothetical protein